MKESSPEQLSASEHSSTPHFGLGPWVQPSPDLLQLLRQLQLLNLLIHRTQELTDQR